MASTTESARASRKSQDRLVSIGAPVLGGKAQIRIVSSPWALHFPCNVGTGARGMAGPAWEVEEGSTRGCTCVQPTADLDESRRCVLAVSVGS
jgi:hypothetical protein